MPKPKGWQHIMLSQYIWLALQKEADECVLQCQSNFDAEPLASCCT